ncbi:MAG: RluA family pseudouridine synthase [Limisphaerales bacterium]
MSADPPTIFTVGQSLPLGRLDTFLRAKFPSVSRVAIQRLLEEGRIQVNGRPAKPAHHPRAGETISVCWPEARADKAQAEDIPLDILHEDDDLLVLNKPAGLVVHPAAGHATHTLVNALLHHCAGRLSGIGGVARPGIVHRLDKDTSGCLVVAKNDAAHLALSEQFAGRQVLKVYQAIVCGRMPRAEGEIITSIARHAVQRKRMAVTAGGGRQAHTSYRVLQQLKDVARVELRLHTGRTHQIRVHLEHLGCPVLGDLIYGKRQNLRLKQASGYVAPRQLLHAAKLGLIHPRTHRRMTFAAPLPEDFAVALSFFRV